VSEQFPGRIPDPGDQVTGTASGFCRWWPKRRSRASAATATSRSTTARHTRGKHR